MELTARVSASTELKFAEGRIDSRFAGMALGDIQKDHPHYDKVKGVIVTEIQRGTRAWSAGLRKGDIITSVNHEPVADLPSFLQLVDNVEGAMLFRVVRGKAAAFLVLK